MRKEKDTTTGTPFVVTGIVGRGPSARVDGGWCHPWWHQAGDSGRLLVSLSLCSCVTAWDVDEKGIVCSVEWHLSRGHQCVWCYKRYYRGNIQERESFIALLKARWFKLSHKFVLKNIWCLQTHMHTHRHTCTHTHTHTHTHTNTQAQAGEPMVKHFPKILASEEKGTMKLKVMFLSGQSWLDAESDVSMWSI